jgi:hypothetical protein
MRTAARHPLAEGIHMNALLLWFGRAAGLAGFVLCLLALGMRVTGKYWLAGFQVGTLLQAGTAAMVFGALCFLAWLVENSRNR